MKSTLESDVNRRIIESLSSNIVETASANFGIKSCLAAYQSKKKKAEILVCLTDQEKHAVAILFRQIKTGPAIAINKRMSLLKELHSEILKIQKNKNLISLVRQVYGSKLDEVLISLGSEPVYSDIRSKTKIKNRGELVGLSRIDAELDFYEKRDRFKPKTRDVRSMLEICLFILIKQCLLLSVPKKLKPFDDETVYSVLIDLMNKYKLFKDVDEEPSDAAVFLRTKRKHFENHQKHLNIRDQMLALGCVRNYDKFIEDKGIEPFRF